MKQPILIAGPTASGKSNLAIKLAKQRDGTIINADALQVYECYNILTARPDSDDLNSATHALYGYKKNEHGYSVGQWLLDIEALLKQIKNTPIIVGGTGLYFKALIEGLAIIPEISKQTRDKLNDEYVKNGIAPLQNELNKVDMILAKTIDMQNHRRVIRALEVARETGMPMSYWHAQTPPPMFNANDCQKILIMPDVNETDKRIATRFEYMMEMGAVDEVQKQMPFDKSLPANKAIGAREIAQYIDGVLSKDEAITQGILQSRQYAKRQRSWFRSNMKEWAFFNSNETAYQNI